MNGINARFACYFRVNPERELIAFYVDISSKAPEGRRKDNVREERWTIPLKSNKFFCRCNIIR